MSGTRASNDRTSHPGAGGGLKRARSEPGGNKVTVVLGAQWGDEGKGKVVDLLATESDIVCRCQVGGSARRSPVRSSPFAPRCFPRSPLCPFPRAALLRFPLLFCFLARSHSSPRSLPPPRPLSLSVWGGQRRAALFPPLPPPPSRAAHRNATRKEKARLYK